VTKGGQCVCKDGSSGGQSGGSSPAAGLSGQNCCPTGRRFNPITNKCDPGDPGKPHLTIVKTKPDSCTLVSNNGHVSLYRCVFTITITNDGTAPATNIPPVIDTPTAGTIVDVQSDGSWNCSVGNNTATCQRPSPLAPGPPTTITVTLEQFSSNYTPNSGLIRDGPITEAQNCAEIDTSGVLHPGQAINPGLLGDLGGQSLKSCDRIRIPRNPRDPPVTTCTPTRKPACSGSLVTVGDTQRRLCHPGECDCAGPMVGEGANRAPLCGPEECMTTCPASATAPRPPPPTITVTCPQGTVLINNQCFFVDPGCRGPNCRPVLVGCPNDMQRNSDGSCPTTTTTGCGPHMVNTTGECTCDKGYSGTVVNGSYKCVKSEGESQKAKKTKSRQRRPDSDNPPPSGPSPGFQIQIGPGFPGGGGGGHRGPTPTKPPPMRNPGVG
jgi:hypothetical protein